ncbi:MAG: hypothetical protein Q8Q88_06725 [Phenylobacterium sp.]|uniref:hypothetical protein n=1 Tax=Phenylobacterium sp. TaxID=1871053 RepID=UPI0027368AE5|nr:hypothetical protein [Phenylobacterium sp.]MDP3746729.1 hypothetical protein [Phenylobacterium sp.]
MTAFSATDAAFEGFRITREKPKVLLIWAGFYLIISLLMPVFLVTMGGQNLMALEAQANNPDADPAAALANLAALAPLYAVLIPIGLAVQAVLAAAVYRAILRPEDTGFGYLRLGEDELRLTGLTLIYFLLSLVAVTVVVLVGGVGAGVAAGLLGSPMFGVGLGLFFLGLLLYVAVRLSLAPVITFAERKISVFDSWALTKGQFWKLLGAYVLAIASVVVVLLLAMVIFMAVAAIVAGGDIASVGKIFAPDLSSVAAYYTPAMIAYTIFGGFLNALYFAVLVSPAAVAYRALKEA